MTEQFLFEEKPSASMPSPVQKRKGMAGWLVSHSRGVIKDEIQANVVLILFVVLMILLMLGMNIEDDEMSIVAPPGREIINEPGVPPRLK